MLQKIFKSFYVACLCCFPYWGGRWCFDIYRRLLLIFWNGYGRKKNKFKETILLVSTFFAWQINFDKARILLGWLLSHVMKILWKVLTVILSMETDWIIIMIKVNFKLFPSIYTLFQNYCHSVSSFRAHIYYFIPSYQHPIYLLFSAFPLSSLLFFFFTAGDISLNIFLIWSILSILKGNFVLTNTMKGHVHSQFLTSLSPRVYFKVRFNLFLVTRAWTFLSLSLLFFFFLFFVCVFESAWAFVRR